MSKKDGTLDLNSSESWPFLEGVDEIVIRVARFTGPRLRDPAAFQVICKQRDRNKAWGGSVMGSPVAAIKRAIEDVRVKIENDQNWPDGKEHGFTRSPLIPEIEEEQEISAEDLLS